MIAGYQRSNWRVFRRVYKEHFRFPEPAPCERACGANYDPLMAKRLGATGMRGCAAARATVCKSRGLLRMCEDNPPERHSRDVLEYRRRGYAHRWGGRGVFL